MSDSAIQIREGGFASLFRHGQLYTREPRRNGDHRWSKHTARGRRPVGDHRARRLEYVYRHRENVRPFRRFPRLESELKLGQPVYCPAFGSGEIAAIEGHTITVTFRDKKREQVYVRDLVTREQAEVNWYKYWLRGAKRRFEEGKRLAIVKGLCRFGEWQAFVDYYDYPRSTADDLIRRYKTEVEARPQQTEMPGYRSSDVAERRVHKRAEDADADELDELVREENEKRHGRTPTYHKTLWTIRIKLPPRLLTRCREQYKLPGAKEYWQRAAYEFIGEDPDYEK